MTNKLERKVKGFFKFKKRLFNYGLNHSELNTENKANNYAFKTTGKPCSCYMCSGLKYSRNIKHKLKKYDG